MFTSTLSPAALAWASGTVTGLGLFAVVGAQSAFILRHGIMRAHLISILAVCALVDAVVIFASVFGLQWLVARVPALASVVLWAGVAFLLWYAANSALRAWRGGGSAHELADAPVPSRTTALLGALAFSLFNPHFWLDMLLIGSLAHSFEGYRAAFGAGAFTASVLWLAALGLGSRLLAPLFSRQTAWRVLDGLIAVVMVAIALMLVARA